MNTATAPSSAESTVVRSTWKFYAGHFMTRAEFKMPDEIRIFVLGEIWGLESSETLHFRIRWEIEVQDLLPEHGAYFCKRVVDERFATMDEAKASFDARVGPAATIMVASVRSLREAGC